MRTVSLAALATLSLLAACASEPVQEPARAPAAAAPAPTPAPRSAPAPQTPPRQAPVADPFSDPSNPLSKATVYYEFDKYDVKAEYRPMVEAHARWLREHPNAKITIEGNCDERGSREYNVALGQRRAENVKKMMTVLGVREQQVEAVSFGEEKPRSSGHDEKAWSQNRRSDIVYGRKQ